VATRDYLRHELEEFMDLLNEMKSNKTKKQAKGIAATDE
jgi:hypothetical protein